MRIFNSLEGMEDGLQKEEMSYTGEARQKNGLKCTHQTEQKETIIDQVIGERQDSVFK